jgi:hypothetical protein
MTNIKLTVTYDQQLLYPAHKECSNSGIDKAPADLMAQEGPQTQRILKSVVGSFSLYSAPLTEGSILDPCYEIWE